MKKILEFLKNIKKKVVENCLKNCWKLFEMLNKCLKNVWKNVSKNDERSKKLQKKIRNMFWNFFQKMFQRILKIWQEKRIGLNLLHFQAKNLFAMKWIFLKMLLLLDAHFQSQKWHPIKWGKERIFDWIDQSITLSYLRFFVHFLKRGICNILLCQKLSNCNPWYFFVKLPRPFTRKSSFNNFFMTS